MARTELVVSEEEAQQLKRVVKRHTNWRMRERAQTLLLLAQGKVSVHPPAQPKIGSSFIAGRLR